LLHHLVELCHRTVDFLAGFDVFRRDAKAHGDISSSSAAVAASLVLIHSTGKCPPRFNGKTLHVGSMPRTSN
jgi:hypothetical protein